MGEDSVWLFLVVSLCLMYCLFVCLLCGRKNVSSFLGVERIDGIYWLVVLLWRGYESNFLFNRTVL